MRPPAAAATAMALTILAAGGPAQADPAAALLSYGELNGLVTRYDPQAAQLWGADPVSRGPEDPDAGLPGACGRVMALYFGGGEPRYRSYLSEWAVGTGNVFVSQLVAQYSSPAQAATKFTRLTADIPACATVLAANPAATMAVRVGDLTADSARFEQLPAGENRQVSNGHDVAVEYRLAGDTIIGVSASYSAALVSAVAGELVARLPG